MDWRSGRDLRHYHHSVIDPRLQLQEFERIAVENELRRQPPALWLGPTRGCDPHPHHPHSFRGRECLLSDRDHLGVGPGCRCLPRLYSLRGILQSLHSPVGRQVPLPSRDPKTTAEDKPGSRRLGIRLDPELGAGQHILPLFPKLKRIFLVSAGGDRVRRKRQPVRGGDGIYGPRRLPASGVARPRVRFPVGCQQRVMARHTWSGS
ncbi:hypothetical protein Naga_100992g3 [Nannochloropsis gaditana]|uniref:Uncharacterized protein n=1 Tax=Nannochloropsis gaditana TaxID=72520 RepID=W7TAH5_9STRA|nr:hypothetical protein Naga_100992g3 [Nannochloropsis gaditana]